MHPMMDAKYGAYKAWIDGVLAEQEQAWAAEQAAAPQPGIFQRIAQRLGLQRNGFETGACCTAGTACC